MKIAKSLTTSTTVHLDKVELEDLLKRAVLALLPNPVVEGVAEKNISLHFTYGHQGYDELDGLNITLTKTEVINEPQS